MSPPGLHDALSTVRPRLGAAWYRYRGRHARHEAVTALTEVVRQLPEEPGLLPPSQWLLRRVMATETQATVAVYGGTSGPPLAVGRVIPTESDVGPLQRNDRALRALRADPRLRRLHPLLPTPLALAEHGSWTCAVERAIDGAPSVALARNRRSAFRVMPLVAEAAGILHRETARTTVVDDQMFEQWVSHPLDALRRAGPRTRTGVLEARLRGELLGRSCGTAWIHGDLWLGNVLLDEGAEQIRGLVDWDAACPQGIPLADLLHLVLTTRALVEHSHLGVAVEEVLDGRPWTAGELLVLGGDGPKPSDPAVPLQVAVILAWLGHVQGVLGKSAGVSTDGRWLGRNVEPVLRWA